MPEVVTFSEFVNGLPSDSSVTGSEKIPVLDSTSKKLTPDSILEYGSAKDEVITASREFNGDADFITDSPSGASPLTDPFVKIESTNSTYDQWLLDVEHHGVMTALEINVHNELNFHENGLSVTSLSSTQQTTASQGLVNFRDLSTTSTNAVAQIDNSGTGDGLYLNQNGNGKALHVETDASTQSGIYVGGTNAFTGTFGLIRGILTSGSSGVLARLENAGSGTVLNLLGSGSGTGLNVSYSGSGEAVRFENSASDKTAIESYVSKSDFAGTGFDTAHRFGITGASATGQNAEFHNTGTGRNVFINQDGNAIALEIDSEATTQSSIYVTGSDAFTSAFGIVRLISPAGSSGRLFRLEQGGSGDAQLIVNDGSGKALYIDNNNTGRSIDVDHDANSASAITGLFINVANAGAGAAYAAIFEAGQVGIGTATPTASAILDVQSTVGAFMPPRMTTVQRDALTASNGMVLYNTSTNELQAYQGGAWVSVGGTATFDYGLASALSAGITLL